MQSEGSKDERSITEEVVKPSFKVGALGGLFGLLLGTFSGTLRSKTPLLFATASGIQCFALGSTYWASRTALLHAKTFHPTSTGDPTSSTYIKASAAAGCITGSSIGILFRGPRNVIPGAIMFTIFGFSGQHLYNFLDERHTHQIAVAEERARRERAGQEVKYGGWRGFIEWLADPGKKWSPIKKLSDREYEEMLQEKLIWIEADLAMIDEEIERVKRETSEKRDMQKETAG